MKSTTHVSALLSLCALAHASSVCSSLKTQMESAKQDISNADYFCQFYLSGHRNWSPIKTIPSSLMSVVCSCILQADGISVTTLQGSGARVTTSQPVVHSCNVKDAATVRKNFKDSATFCKAFDAKVRNISPIKNVSVDIVYRGCACITATTTTTPVHTKTSTTTGKANTTVTQKATTTNAKQSVSAARGMSTTIKRASLSPSSSPATPSLTQSSSPSSPRSSTLPRSSSTTTAGITTVSVTTTGTAAVSTTTSSTNAAPTTTTPVFACSVGLAPAQMQVTAYNTVNNSTLVGAFTQYQMGTASTVSKGVAPWSTTFDATVVQTDAVTSCAEAAVAGQTQQVYFDLHQDLLFNNWTCTAFYADPHNAFLYLAGDPAEFGCFMSYRETNF